MKQIVALAALIIAFSLVAAPAQAGGWYFRPKVGASIRVDDGKGFFTAGAAAGYRWTSFLSAEVAYTRLVGNGNGDQIDVTGRLGLPMGLIQPYAIAGGGIFSSNLFGGDAVLGLVKVGGGMAVELPYEVSLAAELTYVNVNGSTNFIEPAVLLGLGF